MKQGVSQLFKKLPALYVPYPRFAILLNPTSKTAFIGSQQTETHSVCWGPKKCCLARGVRQKRREHCLAPFFSNTTSKRALLGTPEDGTTSRFLGS